MTATTYSLREAAAILMGRDEAGNPVAGAEKWLLRRLRDPLSPIEGFKASRRWRMSEAQIEAAVEALTVRSVVPDVPQFAGMTRTSRRRMAS